MGELSEEVSRQRLAADRAQQALLQAEEEQLAYEQSLLPRWQEIVREFVRLARQQDLAFEPKLRRSRSLFGRKRTVASTTEGTWTIARVTGGGVSPDLPGFTTSEVTVSTDGRVAKEGVEWTPRCGDDIDWLRMACANYLRTEMWLHDWPAE